MTPITFDPRAAQRRQFAGLRHIALGAASRPEPSLALDAARLVCWAFPVVLVALWGMGL